MNRNLRILLVVILVIAVLAASARIFFSRQDVRFDGDRVLNSDRFALRFSRMNTTDSETMTFQSGDTLHVSWQIESGQMDLTIHMEGKEPVYQANGRSAGDTADFDLVIPQDGAYIISVSAQKAKGWVEIGKKQHDEAEGGSIP